MNAMALSAAYSEITPAAPSILACRRRLAWRAAQMLVLLPLFALVLLPEYVQGLGDPETKSSLYRVTLGPLRVMDALLLAVVAGHVVAWASSRTLRVRFPRALAVPALGFVAAVAMAMIYGKLHNGTNLFFDWRALALGAGLYGVFALWTQRDDDVRAAMICFAAFMAVRTAIVFADYLLGGGDTIVGLRIPVYDGPTLSAAVFTGLLAACLADGTDGWRAAAWLGLSAACCLLVLVSFRRTFWTELGVGMLLLLGARRRGRTGKLLMAGVALTIVALALGPSFYNRIRSLDFTQGDSEFSQGNSDHVGEILDAWDQVQQSPVMGIGLGRAYATTRVRGWKDESVMVHNAPLHVWLKYGLLGLACYLWFHFALMRVLWRRAGAESGAAVPRRYSSRGRDATSSGDGAQSAFTLAAAAFVTAQFGVTLGFSPWPYSSVQSATLMAFMLAITLRTPLLWNCRRSQ